MLIRKRKLTQNQSRRIAQNNQNHDDTWHLGVIVSHFGKQLAVQTTHATSNTNAPKNGQIYRCHTRTNLPLLATGDRVGFSFDPKTQLGRIEKLFDRHTLLARPDRYHKLKPIAANSDLLVIVFAPLPKPACHLIDRYLLVAHLSNLPALLLCNKSDLLTLHPDTTQICQEYQALGISTITTSALEPSSLSILQAQLHNKTALFVGQSGVGKSSLINHLIPEATQTTNALSAISKLGQHTTTTSRLFMYTQNPEQGGIIDTPGVREFGVWHIQKDDIFGAFSDLLPYKGECQFRDCNHQPNAKGCALWQAVHDHKILPRRLESFLQLRDEIGSHAQK